MDTLGAVGTASAAKDGFTITLIFFGLALPCIAFAWDGLVRRQMLLPAFPVGAALGQQAAFVKRIGALAIGLFCLLAAGFLLLLVWATWQVAAKQLCHGGSSLACAGSLARSVDGFAWVWLGGCVGWFVMVWLWMGDPRKRILVYGVWYHQEKVARQVNQRLCAQGLAPLPRERLYTLEDGLVYLLRTHGWLDLGSAPLGRETQQAAGEVPSPERMLAAVQRELADSGVGESERVAIGLLLDYFLAQAQQAERMSPLRRWWVGRSQAAKIGVYGRRAL